MQAFNNQQTIVRGTRLHSRLYGGRDGIVYAIHGDQDAQSVRSFGGVSTGGSAHVDVVFANGTISPFLPESIVRGVQWEIYADVATDEEIAAALAHYAAANALRNAKETERKQQFADECARLKLAPDYAHLIPKEQADRHQLAKNLRKDLKANFPGVKFSVRNAHGDTFNVEWTDGPTTAAVEGVVNKFKAGSFNGMEDIYEYSSSPFTEVFGSARYIFARRDYSAPTVQKAINALQARYSGNFAQMEKIPTCEEFLIGVSFREQVPGLGSFNELVWHELTAQTEFASAGD